MDIKQLNNAANENGHINTYSSPCLSFSCCVPRSWTAGSHGSCMGSSGSSSLQCQRSRFDPWVRKIPWRRAWQPIPVFLLGESQGQRSLVDYSPQGHKELDMTEVTEKASMHMCVHTHTHTLILHLAFWVTTIMFSIAAAPFYMSTSNAQGFQFLYIHTNACFYVCFLIMPTPMGMKWYLIVVWCAFS